MTARPASFRWNGKAEFQSTIRVEEESWVLVLSQLVGATGERWLNVMLPNESGEFVLNDSPTGFLPLERITEKVAVPAPK